MHNFRLLILIPARKNSKGIKNKNIVKIKGKPLIQYTINTAKKIKSANDIVSISTDSDIIKKIAIKNSLPFFGFRPKHLSTDRIETKDVVRYELKKIEKILKIKFDYILLLQPTCPIRDVEKIIKVIKFLKTNKKYDSAISVCNVNGYHPNRMKVFKKDFLFNYNKEKKEDMRPRQSLPKVYIRSGSFYLINRNIFLKKKSLVGNKVYGVIIKGLETTNLDTIEDLNFLNYKLKKNEIYC